MQIKNQFQIRFGKDRVPHKLHSTNRAYSSKEFLEIFKAYNLKLIKCRYFIKANKLIKKL